MKPFTRRFTIDMYGTEMLVSVSDNVLRTSSRYNKIFMPWEPDGELVALSRFSEDGNDYGLFLKRGDIYHGDLAHEISHIAYRMLDNKDIQITEDGDEPLAYLVDFITTRLYKIFEKNNIPIQNS